MLLGIIRVYAVDDGASAASAMRSLFTIGHFNTYNMCPFESKAISNRVCCCCLLMNTLTDSAADAQTRARCMCLYYFTWIIWCAGPFWQPLPLSYSMRSGLMMNIKFAFHFLFSSKILWNDMKLSINVTWKYICVFVWRIRILNAATLNYECVLVWNIFSSHLINGFFYVARDVMNSRDKKCVKKFKRMPIRLNVEGFSPQRWRRPAAKGQQSKIEWYSRMISRSTLSITTKLKKEEESFLDYFKNRETTQNVARFCNECLIYNSVFDVRMTRRKKVSPHFCVKYLFSKNTIMKGSFLLQAANSAIYRACSR